MATIKDEGQEMPGNSLEDIQKAKDFLWDYIDEGNRGLLIDAATTDILKQFHLYIKEVAIFFCRRSESSQHI